MVSSELEARLDNVLATVQTETADINLFAPITERDECPICLIPLPLKEDEIQFMVCCGKRICIGCRYKQTISEIKRDREKGVQKHDIKCAFCCQSSPTNRIKALKKLMKKNNIQSFIQMSTHYKRGGGVIQSDTRALEMYIRAAELGDSARAYGMIGHYYIEGTVVEQNKSKAIEFYEVAAKKQSVFAHVMLAGFHGENEKMDESIKHLRVLASAGSQEAVDGLMMAYKEKLLSKEQLTQTLQAFQASNDEMKSKDRDDARAFNAAIA